MQDFKITGLIPVIAQCAKTKEVLMLAYMNQQAFDTTIQTGFMTYFSRSRQKLWKKGETSGHLQKLVAIYKDCDSDSLLAIVEQIGPACHTLTSSCFDASRLIYKNPLY